MAANTPDKPKFKHSTFHIPTDVYSRASINAEHVGITLTNYTHAAHGLLAMLGTVGIDAKSRIITADGDAVPLPRLWVRSDPQGSTTMLNMRLNQTIAAESEPSRTNNYRSMTDFLTRSLRCLNYAFEVNAGNPINVDASTGQFGFLLTFPVTNEHLQVA